MAAIDGAEDVRWSSVVGEYGVLLTEMGSMEELISPIKSYPRIKVCCWFTFKPLKSCDRASVLLNVGVENFCFARIVDEYLTIIPQARMGYWLRGHEGYSRASLKYDSNLKQ